MEHSTHEFEGQGVILCQLDYVLTKSSATRSIWDDFGSQPC